MLEQGTLKTHLEKLIHEFDKDIKEIDHDVLHFARQTISLKTGYLSTEIFHGYSLRSNYKLSKLIKIKSIEIFELTKQINEGKINTPGDLSKLDLEFKKQIKDINEIVDFANILIKRLKDILKSINIKPIKDERKKHSAKNHINITKGFLELKLTEIEKIERYERHELKV